MFSYVILVAALIALTIILVMFNFTTPATIGPLGVLFFFIMIYIVMLGLATLFIKIFHKILHKRSHLVKKDYLYAAVLAFAPIMFLLVQSLGTMNLFTIILIILFIFLGCFLVYKRA